MFFLDKGNRPHTPNTQDGWLQPKLHKRVALRLQPPIQRHIVQDYWDRLMASVTIHLATLNKTKQQDQQRVQDCIWNEIER